MTSQHFSDAELQCPCCTVNACTQGLVDMAEAARSRFEGIYGMGRVRMAVTSGYRCEAHNAAEGGAKHSQHPLGNAIDFHVWILQDRGKGKTEWNMLSAVDVEAVMRTVPAVGGLGLKYSSGMVHADIRPRVSDKITAWCYDVNNKVIPYQAAVQST